MQGRRSYVFFRSWVRIGIGPTHLLRWIVYYCVCIQHDVDKSQISFTELCKTLRTNSALTSLKGYWQLSTFILLLLTRPVSVNIVLWQQNLKFSFQQQTVEFGPTHIFTQIYSHTYYYWYSITHSLFHSRLKSFLFCKSSLPLPFFFLLQDSLYGFPRLFTVTSFYFLVFFCFYTKVRR